MQLWEGQGPVWRERVARKDWSKKSLGKKAETEQKGDGV